MAEVESVPRSVEFYAKLGFEVGDTFVPSGEREATWAWLRQGDADLMIARAEVSKAPAAPSVLFYLYCEDVAQARSVLEQAGVACGPVAFPFYAPKGEFEVQDPDGYKLMITHT